MFNKERLMLKINLKFFLSYEKKEKKERRVKFKREKIRQ
jgi:hypothetical protein